jgi:hypothetical protein
VRREAETHELSGIATAKAYLDHERRLRDVRNNVTTVVPAASSAACFSLLQCICRFLALLGPREMPDWSPQRWAKADIDQVAVTNRDL